jgi:uncharacterized protein YbaR (Trm112 family)
MPTPNPQPFTLDDALSTILACPSCHARLDHVHADDEREEHVVCTGCRRSFAVVDGVVNFLEPRHP